jgi:hypothetical protein
MTASAMAVAVRCHYCSKQLPAWRTHLMSGGAQRICDYCLEWHNTAIEFLAGGAIPGCQGCGATFEFLRDSTLGEEVRMYVVPKDGIYQVLCATCVRGYLPKRADLYKGTAFGTDVLKV